MIETPGAQLINPRVRVSNPLPLARHLHEGQEVLSNADSIDRGRSTPGRLGARCAASGAATLDTPRNRTSRERPSGRSTSAQGRHRRAHHWICQGAPAGHYRRYGQGTERRPRHDRRRGLAHGESRRAHQGARAAHTLSERVSSCVAVAVSGYAEVGTLKLWDYSSCSSSSLCLPPSSAESPSVRCCLSC